MHSNNVINFPKSYNGPVKDEAAAIEEIDKKIDLMKHFHIQETITNIAPMIFNQLDISGFTLSDDDIDGTDSIKDGAFIIEALRSIMCKHYNIYHPFQKLSENVFYPDSDDPMTLKIVDDLNIKLKEHVE